MVRWPRGSILTGQTPAGCAFTVVHGATHGDSLYSTRGAFPLEVRLPCALPLAQGHRMTGRGQPWLAWFGVCALILAAPPVQSQMADTEIETQVKAAYLGNFGLYVQWPKGPAGDDEFRIGVLGRDAVVPLLKKIAEKKTIDNRKISVHHFASAEDYKPCHVLFIPSKPAKDGGDNAAKRLAAVQKLVRKDPVLLVTENEGLALKGAILNFFIDGANVKFEVNEEAAKTAGLQLRSQLLQIGRPVQQPGK